MALTLNEFVGFETGGLEESATTAGSPDATEAVIVRSGDRSLEMPDVAGAEYEIAMFDKVADAGTGHVLGFGFYITNDVISNLFFAEVRTSSGNRVLEVFLLSASNKIGLNDFTATRVDGGLVIAGQWHYVEVYFEALSSSANGELFLDGVSLGTTAVANFAPAGTMDSFKFLSGVNQDGLVYFDDFYWLSGATSAADRLGPGVSVLGFGPGKASATPDYDETGASVVAADDLDIGQWDDGSIVPWGDTAQVQEYTSSGAVGGAVACNDAAGSAGQGPSGGDKLVSGTIKGAKWGFRADRSGGGATTQSIVYGSDDAGTFTAGTGSPATVTLASGAASTHLVLLGVADAGVPTSTETFAIGFANDGGRDFELISYECFLLHVSDTTVTDLSDGLMPEYPSPGLTVEV